MKLTVEHKWPKKDISNKDLHRSGVYAVGQMLNKLPSHKVVMASSIDKVDFFFTNKISGNRYRVKVSITDEGIQSNDEFGPCLQWLFDEKTVIKPADDLFYCFIENTEKGEDSYFTFYIVPSAKVVKSLDDLYKYWLKGKKSRNKKNWARHFTLQIDNAYPFVSEEYSPYLADDFREKWELMK